jgi:hypothetical protein
MTRLERRNKIIIASSPPSVFQEKWEFVSWLVEKKGARKHGHRLSVFEMH